MPLRPKDGHQVTAADTTAEQARVAADTTTQAAHAQDLTVQLVVDELVAAQRQFANNGQRA